MYIAPYIKHIFIHINVLKIERKIENIQKQKTFLLIENHKYNKNRHLNNIFKYIETIPHLAQLKQINSFRKSSVVRNNTKKDEDEKINNA